MTKKLRYVENCDLLCAYSTSSAYQVFCRIRGPRDSHNEAVLKLGDSFVLVKTGKYPRIPETVRAHRVFGPEDTTDLVASSIWNGVVDGIRNRENVVITAIGATVSGKTHTMAGKMDYTDMGVVGSVMCGLGGLCSADAVALSPNFNDSRGSSSQTFDEQSLQGSVSVYEVVGNSVTDLLAPAIASGSADHVIPPEDIGRKLLFSSQRVTTVRLPESAATTLSLLRNALSRRKEYPKDRVGSTGRCSRTHLIISVDLTMAGDKATADPWCTVVLCDLAGTEMVGKKLSSGSLSTEGRQINLDIHYLTEALVSACSSTWGARAPVAKSSPASARASRRGSVDSEDMASFNDTSSIAGSQVDANVEEEKWDVDPSAWKREVLGSDAKVVPGFRNCSVSSGLMQVYAC